MPTSNAEEGAPHLKKTPMVIAPDIILDLLLGRRDRSTEAMHLFDAIAADNAAGIEDRMAWVAPTTIPMIHYFSRGGPHAPAVASDITIALLQLFHVASLDNQDYFEALFFSGIEFDDAIQFVTCRRVGAEFLVTRNNHGHKKRAPVNRRTAAEMLPFFRK